MSLPIFSFSEPITDPEVLESIKMLFTDDSTLQSHDSDVRLTVEIIKSEKVLQEHDPKQKQTIETDISQ